VVVLPVLVIAEFFLLEGFMGISFPSDRGSAVSVYEIREKRTEIHFITRNKRFSIVDLWTNHGSALQALVLRESFVIDRQDGIEGANSMVKVEALDGHTVKCLSNSALRTGGPSGIQRFI
jgi:hypothetical protein